MKEKKLKSWTQYFEEVCSCYKVKDEEFGFNVRLCDMGISCDRCSTIELDVPFERWRRWEIDNLGNKIENK